MFIGRLLALAVVCAAPAYAADGLQPAEMAGPFDRQPEPAAVLADSYGGAGHDDRLRRLADADAAVLLQDIGRTSNVAMDNWWAQTGTALIDNNLLMR